MVPEKAQKKFAAKYANQVQELLVLTAEGVRGAAKWGDGLWEPSCRLLAYIDLADNSLHGGLNQPESVMFFGHSILVEGNINGELSDAYLAG